MINTNDFLSALVDGSTHIISSPETIQSLEKNGVKLHKTPSKTTDQYLDELYSHRRKQAKQSISHFPVPPQIAIPTIGFLYDEIRECILFGLFGSAITQSAILIEFALKHAIVRKTRSNVYDKVEWERVENIELGPSIEEARSLDIIDDQQRIALLDFKNTIRNPYLHYNIKKITRKVAANNVKEINVKTRVVQELDIPAEDNPVLWGLAKKFVDRETFLSVFLFVDQIVKELLEESI